MNFADINLDPQQRMVAKRLAHIARCFESQQLPAQGLYLCGPVGRGKSMLVDNFYDNLCIARKSRMHYHHFMKAVHAQLAQHGGKINPLYHVALNWAEAYQVLCLDEYMVEDIADAMLLGTLWRHLFELDVVLVTTSNTLPRNLYKNGLQRERFLPAIELLTRHCEIIELDNGIDYRRQTCVEQKYPYFTRQRGPKAVFAQLFGDEQPGVAGGTTLEVLGRPIKTLASTDKAVVFDFWDLCSGPRSQRDYMELAARYQVIAVTAVPRFSYIPATAILHGVEENYQRQTQILHMSKLDDEARRFMALVDECYDNKCLIVVDTAAVKTTPAATYPDELYQGVHLRTPFERCASRLIEMQSWPLYRDVSP